MTESLSEPSDIEQKFNQTFMNTAIIDIYSASYGPDEVTLPVTDPIYDQAFNMANGDTSKALDIFKLDLKFRDAMYSLVEDYEDSDTVGLGELLDQTKVLVEYTRHKMNQIIGLKTDG